MFIYSRLSDGEHVTQWRRDGHNLLDWHLPASLSTVLSFTLSKGRVTLHLWDAEQKKRVVASFPNTPSGPPPLKEEGDITFSSTAKRITEQMHAIMHQLHWVPFARPGVHILDAETLIDDFQPLLPYRDELISWTPDYSILSYSWDSGIEFHLAVKQANSGMYVDRDVSTHLFASLDWKPQTRNQVNLYAIISTSTAVIYGLRIEEGNPKEAVVWIDLRGTNWRISRTEAGYLARIPVPLND